MPTIDTLIKYGGRPEPQLIGINDAQTFTGFCAQHDRNIFSPIENQPFTGTNEQIFLIGYRTLCREWYNKIAASDNLPVLQKLDQGRSIQEQTAIQEHLSAYAEGIHAGVRNVTTHKSCFDKFLISNDYSSIRFFRLEFDRPPNVMGSGGIFPEVDFNGISL